MATTYWNPDSWNTSTNTSVDTRISDTTASSGYNTLPSDTSSGATYYYWTTRVVKRVLVREPDHWDKEDNEAFKRLVNIETDTGWKLIMTIKGDVEIADPNVEVRDMQGFIPLFKRRASVEDTKKINEFFNQKGV